MTRQQTGPSIPDRIRIRLTGDHHDQKATVRQLAATANQPRPMTDDEIRKALG